MSEEYARLVEAVQLKQLALIELRLRRDDAKLRLPLKVKYELNIEPVVMDPERLVAKARFSFQARPGAGEPSRKVKADIRMTWLVEYGLEDTGEEKPDVQALGPSFLERNVPINVWPYIRETLSGLTAKMDAPPFLLPPLRIVR